MVPPFTGVAVNVTDVPEQIELPWEVTILIDGTTFCSTDIVILLLVSDRGEAQAELLVIMHETTSPFVIVTEVNEGLFVPTFAPLTFHWYEGPDPPPIGVAVKVVEAPEQIAELAVAIVTDGERFALTLIAIELLVAVTGEAQVALLVRMHEMTSLFRRDVVK